jgi:hypothetical protein
LAHPRSVRFNFATSSVVSWTFGATKPLIEALLELEKHCILKWPCPSRSRHWNIKVQM